MRKLGYFIIFAAAVLAAIFTQGAISSINASDTPETIMGTPSCTPANIILDGGFENGGLPSTIWNDPQSSTNFVTPLCNAACGTGGGASPPRTGSIWAWFGGIPSPETARLGQTIAIPVGVVSLRFWMRIGTVNAPFTDVLNVKIDDVTVQSYVEPPAAEPIYTERIIDLSAFADGSSHNIQFEYIGPSNATGSFVVDDVTLLAIGAGCSSPTPSGTATVTPPSSPIPSCTPAEHIADGTFEAGDPWTTWTVQTSTNFGSSICNTATCGTDSGTATPFAGDNWIWFGGIAAPETSTVGQTVTIPSGGPATLAFQLRIGKVTTPFTDTLTVKIDGSNIATFAEPAIAESNYTLRSFDVSAFADGGSHQVLFAYAGPTTGAANFTVDNISLIAGGVCSTSTATSTPTTTPSSTPTSTPSFVISGSVTYGNTIGAPAPRPVSNVLISGEGTVNVSAATNFPDGAYSLSGFGSGPYTITPSKDGGTNGAITSFDAARIAQHAAGAGSPLTGNQLIVADVSGNGSITSFDAAQVARYAASVSGSGSTGAWKFIPASRNYSSIISDIAGQDYSALLMGEVSGNWTNSQTKPGTANMNNRPLAPTFSEVLISFLKSGFIAWI